MGDRKGSDVGAEKNPKEAQSFDKAEKKPLTELGKDTKSSTTDKGSAAEPELPTEVEEPKHVLQNSWKFWYFENVKERSWEDNLRVVSPFTTVEDFWSIYNHIKSATEIRNGSSYFVFKDGIKPMWEDEGNRKGGRWVLPLDKRSRNQCLDTSWLEVLLCLIGEAFDDDGDDICGAVMDVRGKQDRISIWTADSKNKDRVIRIGKKLKERLGGYPMTYESHEATAVKSSSLVKPLYQV